MYTYEPLFRTMKECGITTYALVEHYKISSHLMSNLRHNKNVTMDTIDTLCKILHCGVSDIVEFKEDEE